VEGVTHDNIRHGTTTLFSALDVATGEVLIQCKPRHRNQEFLGILRQIEKSVLEDLDVHLIVDYYCTNEHAKVRAWLAQRQRFHVDYTLTNTSWLNQVERWFGIITQRAIPIQWGGCSTPLHGAPGGAWRGRSSPATHGVQ
jgi:putative transposase